MLHFAEDSPGFSVKRWWCGSCILVLFRILAQTGGTGRRKRGWATGAPL